MLLTITLPHCGVHDVCCVTTLSQLTMVGNGAALLRTTVNKEPLLLFATLFSVTNTEPLSWQFFTPLEPQPGLTRPSR